MGYHSHAMTGVDFDKPRAELGVPDRFRIEAAVAIGRIADKRSEEHTSELQSLMRISYAVFCLKKKTKQAICQTQGETQYQYSAARRSIETGNRLTSQHTSVTTMK